MDAQHTCELSLSPASSVSSMPRGCSLRHTALPCECLMLVQDLRALICTVAAPDGLL